MKTLQSAYAELIGLFVEDGTLAIVIMIWIGIFALLITRLHGSHAWAGPAMFAGLILLLVENVWRGAKNAT